MEAFIMRLSDKLALEYLKFRNQCKFDEECIEALLCYFKGEFIFTKEQLSYASKEIASFDMSIFLPHLDKIPKFQLILCDDNDNFPNVNIFRDRIENNLSATFKAGEQRNKAIEHFKALFKDAKSIFIYDKFLTKPNLKPNLTKLQKECCISCDIFLPEDQQRELKIGKVDKTHKNYTNNHDRYIIVEDKLEIILTSGIDYLFDTSKDFTYIIREI